MKESGRSHLCLSDLCNKPWHLCVTRHIVASERNAVSVIELRGVGLVDYADKVPCISADKLAIYISRHRGRRSGQCRLYFIAAEIFDIRKAQRILVSVGGRDIIAGIVSLR